MKKEELQELLEAIEWNNIRKIFISDTHNFAVIGFPNIKDYEHALKNPKLTLDLKKKSRTLVVTPKNEIPKDPKIVKIWLGPTKKADPSNYKNDLHSMVLENFEMGAGIPTSSILASVRGRDQKGEFQDWFFVFVNQENAYKFTKSFTFETECGKYVAIKAKPPTNKSKSSSDSETKKPKSKSRAVIRIPRSVPSDPDTSVNKHKKEKTEEAIKTKSKKKTQIKISSSEPEFIVDELPLSTEKKQVKERPTQKDRETEDETLKNPGIPNQDVQSGSQPKSTQNLTPPLTPDSEKTRNSPKGEEILKAHSAKYSGEYTQNQRKKPYKLLNNSQTH
jgi:hypothetical protein